MEKNVTNVVSQPAFGPFFEPVENNRERFDSFCLFHVNRI